MWVKIWFWNYAGLNCVTFKKSLCGYTQFLPIVLWSMIGLVSDQVTGVGQCEASKLISWQGDKQDTYNLHTNITTTRLNLPPGKAWGVSVRTLLLQQHWNTEAAALEGKGEGRESGEAAELVVTWDLAAAVCVKLQPFKC